MAEEKQSHLRIIVDAAVSFKNGMASAIAEGAPRALQNFWGLGPGLIIETGLMGVQIDAGNGAGPFGGLNAVPGRRRFGLYTNDSWQKSMDNLDKAMDEGRGDLSLYGYDGFPFNVYNEIRRGFYHRALMRHHDAYQEQVQQHKMASQELGAFDRNIVMSGLSESIGSLSNWSANMQVAENHIEERFGWDAEGVMPTDVCSFMNRPTDDMRYPGYKPKLLKTEDFGWHANGYERPWANFAATEGVTFRDAEQMRKYMGRFHMYPDVVIAKDIIE